MKTPDVENKIEASVVKVKMKARRAYRGPGGQQIEAGGVGTVPKIVAERLVANGYADKVKDGAA